MLRNRTPVLKTQDVNFKEAVDRGKGGTKQNVDYASMGSRPRIPADIIAVYSAEALRQLSENFTTFRKQDLQTLLYQKNGFYAPAYITCYDCVARNAPVPLRNVGFIRVNVTKRPLPKYRDKRPVLCQEFESERIWIEGRKARYDAKHAQKRKRVSDVHELHTMLQELVREWANARPAPPPHFPLAPAAGSLPKDAASTKLEDLNASDIVPDISVRIKCGCCCDDSTFTDMMQCPDGHLFCKACVRMQAETVIGGRKTEILCMDQSKCKLPFTIAILSQCLDERTIPLWDKIKQAKDIREADIEGVEECPFCDYAVVIPFTTVQLPLFHCAGCNEAHDGQLCHDQIEDARLKAEHDVEEAMTQALLRMCPQCKAPFIKEHGCNKVQCQSCKIYCCYVCRKQILNPSPYHHFYGPGTYVPGKCPLFDGDGPESADPTKRHEAEVAAAEKAARDKLQAAQAGPSTNANVVPRAGAYLAPLVAYR